MKQIFALIGQFSYPLFYLIMMVFTADMYPTAIRTKLEYVFPQFWSLGEDHWGTLLLFGIMTMVEGFIVLLLPVTLNRGVDNTIGEGEISNKVYAGFRCFDYENKEDKKPILKTDHQASLRTNGMYEMSIPE